MKKIIFLLSSFLLLALASCSSNNDAYVEVDYSNVLQSYDLWEIDHSLTRGNGAVPFLDKAITITFSRGILFANNNFSGFGYTGNGFGIDVGSYVLGFNSVEIAHDTDGIFFLELVSVNQNQIQLYNRSQNVTYVLNGYYKQDYNYEYVVYDNIGLLLQEFVAWRKVETRGGEPNRFDEENFLGFEISNNEIITSNSPLNTPINLINWNYRGFYDVFNTSNFAVKRLILEFPHGIEEFDLTLSNNGLDNTIYLYHIKSGTTYTYKGEGYIQYLKPGRKGVEQKQEKKRVVSQRM